MSRPSVVIVSPALATANNGNWQTAHRWQQMLDARWPARITAKWPDEHAESDGIMLALHARRSAPSIDAWTWARPGRGLAVVLTGTDLYRDIAADAEAQRSLQQARRLVVLQELGVAALPEAVRGKARVIYQSTPSRPALAKSGVELHAVMVGHLRDVKDPKTLMQAARLLAARSDICISHIGEASDPSLAALATATQRDCATYRWLGALPHEETLGRIQRAHVLVHTSLLEGGAHVIMEAVCSGTPVLASRVPGNVGMLGADYAGYFEVGDAAGLAALLRQCRDSQRSDAPGSDRLTRLRSQCEVRAPLFDPEAERAALFQLVEELQDPR